MENRQESFELQNRVASRIFDHIVNRIPVDADGLRGYYDDGLDTVENLINRTYSPMQKENLSRASIGLPELTDEEIDRANLERMECAGIEPNERGQFDFADVVRLDPDLSAEEKEIFLASCENPMEKYQ